MTAFSDFMENKIIDHMLRGQAYTVPTTIYCAVFTSTATTGELEAGTLTNEVTGGSYARQAITLSAGSGGATANTGALTFTDMPAATVRYVAIMDASTAGNVLMWGQLTADKTLNAGDTFTIAVGDLDVTIT